jgi:hypothetical protein
MCIALLPKVGYARVTPSGIVILKTSKWSIFRKRIPVTDIVIKYIPIEIGKLLCTPKQRDAYVRKFNDNVATIVSLTKYTDKLNLLDIVYKEYMKICMMVEPEEIVVKNYIPPIPAKSQTYNINSVFDKMRYVANKSRLSDRINKLKTRVNDFQISIPIINLRLITS